MLKAFHQRHAFHNKAMPPKPLQTVPLTGDLVFKYPTLEPVGNILNKRLQNSEKDLGVLYLNFIFFLYWHLADEFWHSGLYMNDLLG